MVKDNLSHSGILTNGYGWVDLVMVGGIALDYSTEHLGYPSPWLWLEPTEH